MADSAGYIRGETLDIIYQFLDEEVLDEEFDKQTIIEEEEVTGTVGNIFKCPDCTKIYKTKAGLSRHLKRYHANEDLIKLDKTKFIQIINETKENFYQNKNFLLSERQAVMTVDSELCTEKMYDVATDLVKKLYEDGDVDNFYSVFYATILMNTTAYLADPGPPTSTMLLKKISEKLVEHVKRKEYVNPNDVPISPKEVHVIQYLAGYIVRKFKAKCKNTSLNILLQSLVKKVDETQPLVNVLNRGGLTAVKDELVGFFVAAEKVFRKQNIVVERFVDIEALPKTVSNVVNVYEIYSSLDTSESLEMFTNLLENMSKLYFRIRLFSTARDITLNHNRNKKATKGKGLRKHLKNAV